MQISEIYWIINLKALALSLLRRWSIWRIWIMNTIYRFLGIRFWLKEALHLRRWIQILLLKSFWLYAAMPEKFGMRLNRDNQDILCLFYKKSTKLVMNFPAKLFMIIKRKLAHWFLITKRGWRKSWPISK